VPERGVFRVVIPARHASTRLPGKVLRLICGKPMLQWVYERACDSGASEVLVAADDERIVSAARACGAEAVLTAASHASGTDRIAELAGTRGWAQDEIVVNVQADEPLIPPAVIAQTAALLEAEPLADIATLATPVTSVQELMDPNVVKVVTGEAGRALYFSRAPIPWNRDGASGEWASQRDYGGAQRHIGIYAYRTGALVRLARLPPSPLEQRERLEQLRALEHGLRIVVATACQAPGPDVNTPADLERVTALVTHARR
jgi:3-deoxy-manno-octulosonate cytidylyltransferase (CMP-KDO synthetase)